MLQIPIQTLNAINTLVQNSRPAFKSLRDYAIRRFKSSSPNATKTSTIASTESNIQKRSHPMYIRPKDQIEKQIYK